MARQKIIIDLYNNFFKIAFKEDTDKLGIVYTPVELVDFIINSVAEVLKREFDRDISDKNVHILDPFTGAGTFISRLIQSGLLGDNLAYKYAHDLHCNEIMLLPYYIASITIENAYHEIVGEDKGYQAFKGICLTDSFQLHESEDSKIQFDQLFRENSERAEAQKTAPIMVIIGNPPYAKSQDDAEKNIKNIPYPILDNRIRNTYAKLSEANLKNALYDPYIKAFRWSSDRLDDNNGGIISFVTNAGWLDGSATDGLRKCLTDEFSSIFVFNLRGNQRTSGEMSKKEGGKIFGSGSRAAIAITVMVKNPAKKGPAKIFYSDIGDYLSRERKLALISQRRDIYNHDMTWDLIKPNSAGDWLNQRSALFEKFIPISDKNNKNNINTIFSPRYSAGLVTSRDAWCYNFSSEHLKLNIESAISFYNSQVVNFLSAKKSDSSLQAKNCIKRDLKYFSWDIKQFIDIDNGMLYKFNNKSLVLSLYRPFQKINCYFNRDLNYRVYLNQSLFPTNHHDNLLICASGVGASKDFSCLISNLVADFQLQLNTQCFPRYYYEPVDEKQKTLFTQSIGGYIRHDGVTDYILKECRSKYGQKVTKDHIFYYVYGLLHSKDYRETFAADLKKMLPRIFLVKNAEDFDSFHQAGKALAKLHLNYETVTPYSKVKLIGVEKGNFIVDKIRFIDKDDKTAIQYNPFIKITGIPLAAYEYVINGRSAIEWILDRYQVKVNKASGLENDPNDWAKEHKEPRYILDLLLRIITVSLETRKIVNSLPRLKF
ncbi:MAG: hypothetical protein LBT86_01650 [Deltaproteobacteria bacterium]|nr:hypothetical protein [Deltaproteobacteria bacterium]